MPCYDRKGFKIHNIIKLEAEKITELGNKDM